MRFSKIISAVIGALLAFQAIGVIAYRDSSHYDLETYTLPYWEGDVVYNETVYPLEEPDGSVAPVSLMYDIDTVISVRDGTLGTLYEYGRDYTVTSDGQLAIIKSGRIKTVPYSSYYLTAQSANSMPRRGGGYVYFSEGAVFHRAQIAVTYTHSDTWSGSVPECKSDLLPKTYSRLASGSSLSVVFFGDSVVYGCNASGLSELSAPPYMPTWFDMTVAGLRKNYPSANISYVNTAVGGTMSDWGVSEVGSRVTPYSPDLVVLGFGTNDGTAGVAPGDFGRNIRSIIDSVRASRPSCEFLLLSPFYPNPETYFNNAQESYLPVLKKIEEDYTGVAFTDVMTFYRELTARKKYADMTGNNVNHPNDFYIRYYAQNILMVLSPFDAEEFISRAASELRERFPAEKYREAERAERDRLIASFESTAPSVATGKPLRSYLASISSELSALKTDAAYAAEESGAVILFSSDAAFSAITPAHAVTVEQRDGVAVVKSTGDDPYFRINVEPYGISADDTGYLVAVYRVPQNVTNGAFTQLFFSSDEEPGESEARSLKYNADKGAFAFAALDVSSVCKGKIRTVRIDPFATYSAGDTFELYSLCFFRTETDAVSYGNATVAALNRKPREDDVFSFSAQNLSKIAPGMTEYYVGDTDGDGGIRLEDLSFLKRVLAGGDVLYNEYRADVDLDEKIGLEDLPALKKILAGAAVAPVSSYPSADAAHDKKTGTVTVTATDGASSITVDVTDKNIDEKTLSSVSALIGAPEGTVFTLTLGGGSVALTTKSDSIAKISADVTPTEKIESVTIETVAPSYSIIALIFSYK